MVNLSEKEIWKYCQDQICPYCLVDISFECYWRDPEKTEIVTNCPFCNRSFIE